MVISTNPKPTEVTENTKLQMYDDTLSVLCLRSRASIVPASGQRVVRILSADVDDDSNARQKPITHGSAVFNLIAWRDLFICSRDRMTNKIYVFNIVTLSST